MDVRIGIIEFGLDVFCMCSEWFLFVGTCDIY